MRIMDRRLAAIVAAAGLWIWAAAPALAACDSGSCVTSGARTASAGDSKPVKLLKSSKRTPHKLSSVRTKTAVKDRTIHKSNSSTAEASPTKASDKLPSWFVNANAALPVTSATTPSDDAARNIAATDDDEIVTMDGVQIASAQQLNDIDRAVANDTPEIKPDDAAAAIAAPAPPQGRILRPVGSGEKHVLANTDSNPWSKTSLIGKIFIAFGSLLTVASAARMLIA